MKAEDYPLPARSNLLRGIPKHHAIEILSTLGAKTMHYSKGQTIIKQWSRISHYYLVCGGRVMSYCTYPNGRRSINGVFQIGDVFGIVFAFSDLGHNPSMAVALSDVVVIRIPIVDIIDDNILISSPIRRRYLQNAVDEISQSAYKARLRAFVVSRHTIKDRLMAYLNEKAKQANSAEFDIPFDRKSLADFLAADKCVLSTVLGRMKSSGRIDYSKNHFRILQPFY